MAASAVDKASTVPIPDFIQARGPVALKAYRRALEIGRTFDRRTNIVLIDQDLLVFQEVKSERKPEEVSKKVLSLVERGLKGNETSDNENRWPFFSDFASQAVYNAIVPIFLLREAIYVLVLDLEKELRAPAQCRMRPPNHDEIEVNSPYVEDTNLDRMIRWLDLVHSLGRQEFQRNSVNTKDVFPRVVLVGTNADGVRDPSEEMNSVMETICSTAHSATVYHISKESFFIDNTNPDREEDPQIDCLCAKILDLAEKMPDEEIPLQWHRVEQKIDEMVKEEGIHYVDKKRFTEDISGNICQFNDNDDVEELLHFLQARGRVIYQDLPENPDGMVVLDPQWLIKIICEIITMSPPWKNDPIIQKDYQVLGKKGLLSQQLLDRAIDHLELNDIKDSLIHIMESLGVICKSKNCKGENYPFFVPCLLGSPKKNTRGTNMRNGPLSVFLTFNSNFVPSGLFWKLVVHFWEWASQLCGSCIVPSLFEKTARFNVSKEYHLTLECHKTVIKLIIWTPRDSDKMEEKRICKELLSLLERCRTRLSATWQWLRSVTMKLHVKCQLCEPCPDKCRDGTSICILHKVEGCSRLDCGHYIPLKSFGLSCEHSVDAVPYYPAEELDPWVQALKSIECKKRTGSRNEKLSPCDALTSKERKTGFAVKQEDLRDEDLQRLSHKLEEWKPLGRRLKIEEATLTEFDDDCRKKREKIYKMLQHWNQANGAAATYMVLHDALCHTLVGRTDLAEQFCCQPHE